MEKHVYTAGKYKGLLFAVTNIEESQLVWYTIKGEYAAEVAKKDVEKDSAVDDEKLLVLLEKLVDDVAKRSA